MLCRDHPFYTFAVKDLQGAPIVERDQEREILRAAIRGAAERRGSVTVVVGEPGIGKTTLLADAIDEARDTVLLSARGTPVGRDLAFGVLHQLFGEHARRGAPGERPFDGQGTLLHTLLTHGAAPADTAAITQAVHWVVASLADDGAVVFVVDDLQWADAASLTVLGHIAALLPGEGVTLIGAARNSTGAEPSPALSALLATAQLVQPKPLSESAIARLSRGLSIDPARVRRLTGGIPFYVTELIANVGDDGELTGSAEIIASVDSRLDAVGPAGRSVAAAVATLAGDDDGDPRVVAEVAGVDPARLEEVCTALIAEGVLHGSESMRTAHPLVSDAILGALDDTQRRMLHDRSMAALRSAGKTARTIAAHALRGTPTGEDERVDLLLATGRAAIRSGSHVEAAAYLGQAVRELSHNDSRRSDALGMLATVLRAAGDLAGAAEALTERLADCDDVGERASCRVMLGDTLFSAGDFTGAERVYAEGLADLVEAGFTSDSTAVRGFVARALSAQLTVIPTLSAATVRAVKEVTAQEGPDTAEDCMLLAASVVGFMLLPGQTPVSSLPDLAARAYAGWAMDTAGLADDPTTYLLSGALNMTGLFDEGIELLTNALIDARRSGHALSEATSYYCRGAMHLSAGDVRQALPDLAQAVGAVPLGWSHYREAAETMLLRCLLAMGDADSAATVARGMDSASSSPLVQSVHLVGRSVWATAEHDPVAGLEFARAAGRALPMGMEATFLAWREPAFEALMVLDQPSEARALAEEELTVVEAGGNLPGPRAAALLRLARATADPQRALELSREASALVSGSRLLIEMRAEEHAAERLIELHRPEEAQHALLNVLRYSRAHALAPTERRTAERLAAIGHAAPPSTLAMRVASLSAAERRVAELAAEGLTNRQIATQLFVTLKTVEFHLSRCFRKLAIATRGELAKALDSERHVA